MTYNGGTTCSLHSTVNLSSTTVIGNMRIFLPMLQALESAVRREKISLIKPKNIFVEAIGNKGDVFDIDVYEIEAMARAMTL